MITISEEEIEQFLVRVDKSFPVPISQKQELHLYAKKLHDKATLCVKTQGSRILAMVAGYTEDIVDDRAYIALVATLEETQGKGFASELVKEFIGVCRKKKIAAVHLYASAVNAPAMTMYSRLGFHKWEQNNEPRPEDIHFIYYID